MKKHVQVTSCPYLLVISNCPCPCALGLALASGLVVFVSVLSDAYTDHPRHSQLQPFHYRYGWSFFTAGAAFVLAEVAALLSMTAYLQRFPSVEDMVRAMVPGADRRLQQRQLCKEFMVRPCDTLPCSKHLFLHTVLWHFNIFTKSNL